MAEYKSLAELLKKFDELVCPEFNLNSDAGRMFLACKKAIIIAPTADVVSRAEVERLQGELEVYKTNALSMAQTMPNMAKAERKEVAREIFAEMEERCANVARMEYGGFEYFLLGKAFFTELKKKYTEGEDDPM